MIEALNSAFAHGQDYAGRIFLAASVILIAELILPMSRYSWVSRVRGAVFWMVYIVITATSMTLFYRLWGHLGVTPLFRIDLRFLSEWSGLAILDPVGGVLASLLVLQVSEFFYYWFHRLQHSSRFFWRFHAEHHSLEEMSAFNSNHHFTEEIFRIPFVAIPISLLFSFEQGYVPWLWALLLGWQGIYEHSSTKVHFGFLRYVVPDNRFHRIHHSVEKRHHNKNFGSGSALWDIVFGTIHHPEKDEWPDVGVSYMREPKTLSEFMWRPFKRKKLKTKAIVEEPVKPTQAAGLTATSRD
ncbi:putative transmembrane fatty acid synthesis protein [Devosia sp. LC5]|uniref:sterol desaturase family protein n=1 Tax=Devosia sp. LC5 TaxID=1502724 RepID=UPI0004E3514A|nr:sterol desaturase family protein [Devosia sp. LC5]KFC62789.1 putative transmembrane fatty acid synthesis protein [Devosia sp. LC5]